MKKLIFLVALAMACPGWAQAPTPPAKAQVNKAKTAKVAKKHRRAEDARHCLQRGDNNAIIKCAEEYL